MTLIEVIFSLGLFGLLALTVLTLAVNSKAAGENGEGMAQACDVIEGQLDFYKHMNYTTIAGYASTAPAAYNVTEGGVQYQVSLNVTRLGTDSTTLQYQLLDLRLQTTWQQKQALGPGSAQEASKTCVTHTVIGPSNTY